MELLVLEPFVQRGDLQVDYAGDVLLRERLVEDDLVEPVQQFGAERPAQLRADFVLGRFADLAVLVDAVQQRLRAEIARQNQDRVLEVDRASLRVGDSPVIEHLQQDVDVYKRQEQCDMFFYLVILPFLICFEQCFRPATVHKLYLA